MNIVRQSKAISELKKGDFVIVDGKKLEVDAHYVFEDYKTTKEMLIELFDSVVGKDYQIRYFEDQVKDTLKFYELKEIIYEEVDAEKIEW